MKYKVNIKEVHNLEVEVEAESKEQAKLIVRGALARADEYIINYDFLTDYIYETKSILQNPHYI